MQMLPDLRIIGRRLCENRAERRQKPLVQQDPITLRGGRSDRGAAPEVSDLAPDRHQQPVRGEQQATSQKAGGLNTARRLLYQRPGSASPERRLEVRVRCHRPLISASCSDLRTRMMP